MIINPLHCLLRLLKPKKTLNESNGYARIVSEIEAFPGM
jgi:hypothetical protein